MHNFLNLYKKHLTKFNIILLFKKFNKLKWQKTTSTPSKPQMKTYNEHYTQ